MPARPVPDSLVAAPTVAMTLPLFLLRHPPLLDRGADSPARGGVPKSLWGVVPPPPGRVAHEKEDHVADGGDGYEQVRDAVVIAVPVRQRGRQRIADQVQGQAEDV